MIYLCYFLFFFLVVRLLVSLTNYFTFCYLPRKDEPQNLPKVSILIPARNEERNIGIILNQLKSFSYQQLEILVYNDNSADNTAKIVEKHRIEDKRITLFNGEELPEGWLGKNYACHQLANKAGGEILLFLDADVNIKNGLIERALFHMQKYDLHLLSIFPKQIFKSIGEIISVPLMNWILLSFLPLILIRKSKNPAFSAANGQFMLFRSEDYMTIKPHKRFRLHQVEDIAILKYYKKKGLKTDTLLGNDYIKCRMYSGGAEAINGFSKNIFQFFGNSIWLTIFVGVFISVAPFVVYLYLGTLNSLIYLFGAILLRIFVSLASKQSVFRNLLFMIPQQVVFLLIIFRGLMNYRKKELLWKGRNIYQS